MGAQSTTMREFIETERTRDPNIELNFNHVQTNWLFENTDYGYLEWEREPIVRAFTIKTLITCFMSFVCIVFNSLLFTFLLSKREYRNLKFFPVFVQTAVDILGPGAANLIYEVIAYMGITGFVTDAAMSLSSLYFRGFDLGMLEDFSRVRDMKGCILTFFRSLLNEYTTGLCVVATAFIRYILVCRPTSTLFKNKKALIAIAVAIVLGGASALCANLIVMTAHFLENMTSYDRIRIFYVKCDDVSHRQTTRLVIESCLFLGLPALFSMILYTLVGVKLLSRSKSQARNRNLTLALSLSCVLWVVCWGPAYWAMSIDLNEDDNKDKHWFLNTRKGSALAWFNIYFVLFKTSLQMTYSHVNAFIFLIVLKPFRIWLIKKTKTFYNFIIGKRSSKTQIGVFGLLMLTCTISALGSGLAHSFLETTDFASRQNFEKARQNLQLVRSRGLSRHSSFIDLFSPGIDIRFLCGKNHGLLEFEYKRCYFIGTHSENKLDFWEQAEFCNIRDATLSYPRSKNEIGYIFNFYKSFRGWDHNTQALEIKEWYLHLGIQRSNRGSFADEPTFLSTDGKFNFTSNEFYWFTTFTYPKTYTERKLRGPVVCITNQVDHLFDCLSRTKRKYTICSIDFSQKVVYYPEDRAFGNSTSIVK